MQKVLQIQLLVPLVTIVLATAAAAEAGMPPSQSCAPSVSHSRGAPPIDDEMVIAMLLGIQALPPQPNKMQESRFKNFVDCVGLGRQDVTTMRLEMVRLYELMTPIQQQLQTPGSDARTYLDAFRAVRLETWDRLQDRLSDSGKKRLQKYAEDAKRNGTKR